MRKLMNKNAASIGSRSVSGKSTASQFAEIFFYVQLSSYASKFEHYYTTRRIEELFSMLNGLFFAADFLCVDVYCFFALFYFVLMNNWKQF